MDLADMVYTQLFWGILLVPLMGLDGTQGPCPTLCHCSLEILNCSRITKPPGFHQIPLPKPTSHPHPFVYLDFTGNAISSIGKEVWNAYPWAEYLVLKNNSLRRLQVSSLEGLLSLTYLDLSCNKIQTFERNAFEAVPFLQVINLSGNKIKQITEGTFQAWHGMQFLLKVDLSHNPLASVQDPYFYRLPLLKFLDLGATQVTLRVLEDLLQNSLQLKTLILPKKLSCCLCKIKEDIDVLPETVKLECTESCDTTLCGEEEPLNQMQEEVTKALEIRKLNGSGLLNILPEKARPSNAMPERNEHNHGTLVLAQNYSSLVANLNLIKTVKELMQMKADEPLDINWADESELQKLYLLTNLLQKALKEKIVELSSISPEATVQNELSDQVLDNPKDEARKRSVERWKELEETLHALKFRTSRQLALQSSWKRAISDSLMNAFNPPGSNEAGSDENDSTSLSNGKNSVIVLNKVPGSQILTKEEQHTSDHLVGDGESEISAGDSETSLNELSPQRTSVNQSPLGFSALQGNNWNQGEVFERELNKKLSSFIPNTPARNLISHIVRILKIDCAEPTRQMACSKLISRTDLLMTLFSENVNDTSDLWKFYFSLPVDVTPLPKENTTKLEKPPGRVAIHGNKTGRVAKHGIPAFKYKDKLLLAISVSAIILIIIAVISLIVMWSRRCTAKDKIFLDKEEKPLSCEELQRTPSPLMDKPLWLKDMCYDEDEIQRSNMMEKFQDEESLEEMEVVSWTSPRPSITEPPPSVPVQEQVIPLVPPPPPQPPAPPPPSPPPPPQTPAPEEVPEQKSPDIVKAPDEPPSSKAVSLPSEGEEGKETPAEKSENPSTVAATSEEPSTEGGEGEGEYEDEDDEEEESE